MGEFSEKKILICISNFLVWAKTPPKEKQEGAEEQPDINEEEQEEPDTDVEGKDIPNEEDFPKKVANIKLLKILKVKFFLEELSPFFRNRLSHP
jgi:hypothetical protein